VGQGCRLEGGTWVAIKCPGCGKDGEDEARFCNSCGAAIDGSVPGPCGQPPYGQPPYSPPPAKKSKVWLWVTLSVVSGLVVLGLLYTIFFSEPPHHYYGSCINHLRTIDSAIMQYSAAHSGAWPNGTADLEGTYIRAPFPQCGLPKPADYTYSDPGTNRMRAVCPNGHTY
jgi:hypothetical protein